MLEGGGLPVEADRTLFTTVTTVTGGNRKFEYWRTFKKNRILYFLYNINGKSLAETESL